LLETLNAVRHDFLKLITHVIIYLTFPEMSFLFLIILNSLPDCHADCLSFSISFLLDICEPLLPNVLSRRILILPSAEHGFHNRRLDDLETIRFRFSTDHQL